MEDLSAQMYGRVPLPNAYNKLAVMCRVMHHIAQQNYAYMKQKRFPWSYDTVFWKEKGHMLAESL